MDSNHTADTTQAQTTSSQEQPKKKYNSCIHAVLQSRDNSCTILKAKQRGDLAKMIASDENKDSQVIGVFKGKQLAVTEKKSYHLSDAQ